MSAKNLDRQGRWRSVTVAFRVSPEEDALIEAAVRISGCTKQDYIIKKLTDQSVVVQGNPKVYRGLKLEMRQSPEAQPLARVQGRCTSSGRALSADRSGSGDGNA